MQAPARLVPDPSTTPRDLSLPEVASDSASGLAYSRNQVIRRFLWSQTRTHRTVTGHCPLGKGSRISGKACFEGAALIEGTVEGEIVAQEKPRDR